MAIGKKNDILLEIGTNELEVLEFVIAERHFGINVSKVVEILQSIPVTPMPNSSEYIRGVFKPRERIMTLVNLPAYLGLPDSETPERDIYIITNFNNSCFAFHVHSVEVIHRVSWEMIEKPDESVYGGRDGLATGIARIENRLVTIIDFEKIIAEISPSKGIPMSEIDRLGERASVTKPIMIVEDSVFLRNMLLDALEKAGYANVSCFSDGKEAWDKLREYKQAERPVSDFVKCVITDIEMPKMDGSRLTKLIKSDAALRALPVIVFSSLINEEMRQKCALVGSDAQLTKPRVGELVGLIDKLALD